jgi:hypothetical protein
MLSHAVRRTPAATTVCTHDNFEWISELPECLVYCGEPEADLSFAWEQQRIGASRGEFGPRQQRDAVADGDSNARGAEVKTNPR